MDAHSDPTENLDPSLLNGTEELFLRNIRYLRMLTDSTPSQSANEDINSLISGMKIFYSRYNG